MSKYPANPTEIARLLDKSPDPSGMTPKGILKYARAHGHRWRKAEPYIIKDPELAYKYARDVLKERWPEAEPYIMKDPEWAYYYAFNIVHRRWPEAEPIIMTHPYWAYRYALYVLMNRWPEYEAYMVRKASANPNPMDDYEDTADDWWAKYQQDLIR